MSAGPAIPPVYLTGNTSGISFYTSYLCIPHVYLRICMVYFRYSSICHSTGILPSVYVLAIPKRYRYTYISGNRYPVLDDYADTWEAVANEKRAREAKPMSQGEGFRGNLGQVSRIRPAQYGASITKFCEPPGGPKGSLGPLKKSLRSGPKGPKGPLGPLESRFAPGSMPGVTQNGRLHLLLKTPAADHRRIPIVF